MNLLMRLLRFLALLAFRLSLSLIAVLIRLLMPYLFATLRILRTLVFTSLTATVNGPRQYTDRLASDWTRQLLDLGLPRDNLDQTYSLCRYMAGTMIVLGWIVSILFTVAFLWVVSSFFI